MKLMNFRRFDPDHKGKGLQRGNKDEGVVWKLYASSPKKLRGVADNIRAMVSSDEPLPPTNIISDDEEEAEEGQVLTRIHRYRERKDGMVKRKKKRVLKDNGTLSCEVCGFDFVKVYGERGEGFIECHHTKPVSELKVGEKTKSSDLSLLCSNCHRMIHQKRPWLSVEGLEQLLKSKQNDHCSQTS
jgi:5-methylcytosine-specific restriction enzyme A